MSLCPGQQGLLEFFQSVPAPEADGETFERRQRQRSRDILRKDCRQMDGFLIKGEFRRLAPGYDGFVGIGVAVYARLG